jgi:hypothetical protein
MDLQTIINLGATVMLGVVGWFVRDIKSQAKETADALGDLRLRVAQDYVTHAHLADIKTMLRRIEDKLDGKQDKE